MHLRCMGAHLPADRTVYVVSAGSSIPYDCPFGCQFVHSQVGPDRCNSFLVLLLLGLIPHEYR